MKHEKIRLARRPGGILGTILGLLTRRERVQLFLLAPAIVVMGVLQTASLATLVPFVSLLADPMALEGNGYLGWAYRELGFSSRDAFFFAVGSGVLCLLTLGNAFSALVTWALLRFSWMRNHTLSMRLLARYLERPFEFFLTRNTTELSKNILSEVEQAVVGVFVAGLHLVARLVVVVFIAAAIFAIDPGLAVALTAIFTCVYAGLYVVVRQRTMHLGRTRARAQGERFKIVTEMFRGIKELKLLGLEEPLLARFSRPSKEYAKSIASSSVIAQLPRYALESVAVGWVLLAVLLLLGQGRPLHDLLPIIGVYAFAAYRMIPGLQAVFVGLAEIGFNRTIIETLSAELTTATPAQPKTASKTALKFERSLRLDSLDYRYPNSKGMALANVNLDIRRGEWIAIVGPTGGGKSTLVDVILGLLRPTRGRVVIDGAPLSEDQLRAWQLNLAYVPQDIFLLDDTVIKNIAFGVEADQIDEESVRRAARIAQIHDFAITRLPEGYETILGERGLRISGGQRQRIGIARALYRRPRLLVLDEATSALDNLTEADFFHDLRSSSKSTTVISVSHRLTTTRGFDRVVLMDDGKLAAVGTPSDAMEGRNSFGSLFSATARQDERWR